MVEIIDQETNKKVMAMILCNICYKDDCYIIFAVQRDKEDANVFVSKLIKNSRSYVMNNKFKNGEKQVMEKVVQRILNRESREVLESDGFFIIDDISLDEINYFDIKECYVSTVSKKLIKDCLISYNLVNEKIFEQPIVEVIEDKRKFNEGFASNIILIIFGVFIVIFSIIGIIEVLFR